MKLTKLEISGSEAEALLERVKDTMAQKDYQIIKGLVDKKWSPFLNHLPLLFSYVV